MKTTEQATTIVIFRKWNSGEIIALFPEVAHDVNGVYCSSYQHIGQHGAASPDTVILQTMPATPSEYNDTMIELQRIGYRLDVRSRMPSNAYAIRRATAGL